MNETEERNLHGRLRIGLAEVGEERASQNEFKIHPVTNLYFIHVMRYIIDRTPQPASDFDLHSLQTHIVHYIEIIPYDNIPEAIRIITTFKDESYLADRLQRLQLKVINKDHTKYETHSN